MVVEREPAEVKKLIEIYKQLETAGLMVTAGKRSAAELLVSHDVIPVVRCKNCKHLKLQDENDARGDCDIHDTWFTRTPESYCCYGERKEESL